MNARVLILFFMTFMCIGCANISTLSRTTTLPPMSTIPVDGTGPSFNQPMGGNGSGLAIHLDAAQRLVLTKPGFVCSEPSPDALQAFASGLGFGINIPGSGAGQVAQALSTSAGSIGLRTQSITLMREQLFQLCLAAYNGSITGLDVAQQLRQAQDMALGVLAIEQLTGAVIARQVVIGTSANASASGNLIDSKTFLARARDDELAAKDSLLKATTKRDEQQKAVDKRKAELPDEQTRLNDEELKKLNTQLEQDNQAVANATASNEDAQATTKAAKANFDTASASASAAASGKGEFSGGGNSYKPDSATVNAISGAVERIVSTIITKGHLTDSCIGIMNRFAVLEGDAQKPSPQAKQALAAKDAMEPLYAGCKTIFEANVNEYKLNMELYLESLKQQGKNTTPTPTNPLAPVRRPPPLLIQ